MKKVLITGASGGLGKELSRYFAANGWQVIATMLSLDLAEEMKGWSNVQCYELDVSSNDSILKAKKDILADHQHIDTIINNAGRGYRSFVELADDKKIEQIIDINWMGVMRVCRAFIPLFKRQQYGQFINISSIAGLVNLPLGNFYHSTKHAIESFSECMAYELKEANIKVCTVQFGNIPTDFQKSTHYSDDTNIKYYKRLMARITHFLTNRTQKNTHLISAISHKVLHIAEHPAHNFKRYTIGFDARLLITLYKILGYQLFSAIIRCKILNYKQLD
ncbi:MAG: SDR family NAD(P)-dependent oxidoreductase [Chitinophagaceae bacterium]